MLRQLMLLLLSLSLASIATARPQRVVSLNLCTDQLLLELAEPTQLASLSFLSTHAPSAWRQADPERVHINRGGAEEILPLEPDLIVSGEYGASASIRLLEQLGQQVQRFPLANDFAGLRKNILRMSELLGWPERGAAAVARFDAVLAEPAPQTGLRVLNLEPRGYTHGAGTLRDAVFNAARLTNIATEQGISGYGLLSLEAILRSQADFLVLSPYAPGTRSQGQKFLQHPALRATLPPERVIEVPAKTWICAGSMVAEAIQQLRSTAKIWQKKGRYSR